MNESSINDAVPADNTQVDKALLRQNFRAAKEEINDLYQRNSLPWQIAFGTDAMLN